MKNIQSQIGVTLMELVVTLAILGVLAAVGTPVLIGNIRAAKNAEAQNTLKAIYLMQKNYFVENYCYYVNSDEVDGTSLINEYLLGSSTPSSGPITVGGNNDFIFYTLADTASPGGSCTGNQANAYIAYAQSRTAVDPATGKSLVYSINQQNVKTGF